MPYVEMRDVVKEYKTGDVTVKAVAGASFAVDQGKLTLIVGPSGAGKSTILNILGGMDRVTSGVVTVDGKEINKYDTRSLTRYRRYDVGFVFQFYNLAQNLTALENVELAAQICREPFSAHDTLKRMGLENRMDNFPAQLSGGEQQRVAIARAVAKNPKILLCDEPTGALDYQTGKNILSLLQSEVREHNRTCVIITHNTAISPMADRILRIKNGVVADYVDNPYPMDVNELEW